MGHELRLRQKDPFLLWRAWISMLEGSEELLRRLKYVVNENKNVCTDCKYIDVY